jgi:hypothetical protein
MFPVIVPPANGNFAAIALVTVVLKLASSFKAAAISFKVFNVPGAEEDATIFSDGTSGYMRGFVLQNKAGNKDVLTFADGGATSLYHNNVAKLATT